jgi:hypothetical protein
LSGVEGIIDKAPSYFWPNGLGNVLLFEIYSAKEAREELKIVGENS